MARFLIGLSIFGAVAAARDLDKQYRELTVRIGAKLVRVYVADDDAKRELGLMHVEKLPADAGMLFVFDEERPLSFWMKNTLIPLQIAFFDRRGKIVKILEMRVADSLMSVNIPSYSSVVPALMALEMNSGWFTKNKIKVGDRLIRVGRSDSSSLDRALPLRPQNKQPRQ